jgi:transcriptional regulator with XRE-family HTH domain
VAPEVGVNYTHLSKIENGVAMPSPALLSRLASYYAADSDQLHLAAERLPPDVETILSDHREEAILLLRSRFDRAR